MEAQGGSSISSQGRALMRAAQALGVDPLDLGAMIGAETGGTYSPSIVGGEGKKYKGLIQFGPAEREKYGVRPGQTFEEQVEGPVVYYLKDRYAGVGMSTEGADLLSLYTTVLAGNPKANINSKDSFGTSPASGVAKMAPHREEARRRFFGGGDPGTVSSSGSSDRGTGFNGTPMAGSRDVADLLKQNPMAATALAGLAEPQSESPFEREIKRRYGEAVSGKMPSFDQASTRPYSLEDVMSMGGEATRRNPVIDLLLGGSTGATAARPVAASAGAVASGSSGSGTTGQLGFKPVEYLTGDKDHHGYDPSHGGDNYHEHLAFGTPEEARKAAKLLNENGIKTTELQGVNRVGRHSDRSYHYSGQAFDVPASQVPVGQEQGLSRRVRSILKMA